MEFHSSSIRFNVIYVACDSYKTLLIKDRSI